MSEPVVFKACGRVFDRDTLGVIANEIVQAQPALRAEIARRVCAALDWTDGLGQPKLMSCRVALLRLHRAGLIALPAPTRTNGNGAALKRPVTLPDAEPIEGTLSSLVPLALESVQGRNRSALWNRLMERYHYLGYTPLPGAQLRYLVHSARGLVGAIGFGACAWRVAPRDTWIGWNESQRARHREQVLNNARFLLLPWVRVPHLASKVLALSARRVRTDFAQRYGIEPVLLETFVEVERFAGTCYRAANWQRLGVTQGRGKCDRARDFALPVKAVYVYPLHRDFRAVLCA